MRETSLGTTPAPSTVAQDIDQVCLLVPPLWELDSFVAVNPFVGFSAMPMPDAARVVGDALDAQVLPPMNHYRELWKRGGFGDRDLANAAAAIGVDASHLRAMLCGEAAMPMRERDWIATRAERFDREHGTRWNEVACDHSAAACARHAMRHADLASPAPGLFEGWLDDAAMDRALETEGLRGMRAWVRTLPRVADDAIAAMLDRVDVAAWERQAYLYRLLGGVHGWASHFRRRAWVPGRMQTGLVREVLAIRIGLDVAVMELATRAGRRHATVSNASRVEDERVRLALQGAVEDAHARRIAGLFAPPPPCAIDRPLVQAAFCIDVRSEPLRRHLEACDAGVNTIGFAGFFGVAMRWRDGESGEDRCPVLIQPAVELKCSHVAAGSAGPSLLPSLLGAPGGCFAAVETIGLGALAGLASRAFRSRKGAPRKDSHVPIASLVDGALGLEQRVQTAIGMLAGMGLRERFARLVVLCGHQGRSENNPHAAGLDCGACGGHGGALNARVAARLLNDAAVRAALRGRGMCIPAETRFVAAVHDTCTDQVHVLDLQELPDSHSADLARLRGWLDRAGHATRRERAAGLNLDPQRADLTQRLADRGGDWSQTRPEWALARNMCFVAARRARTAGRDLQGRAFLHEYDASLDTDDAVLSLILSAPMVVASWINLQYFASTVDNRVFGSGDKMLHNRVGSLGVVVGNGHDLRGGLPLQSVQGADGAWFHEPLRLQVFVEAGTDRIDRVLASQPGVRDLVAHGWVRLFALDPAGREVSQFVPGRGWQLVEALVRAVPAAPASVEREALVSR